MFSDFLSGLFGFLISLVLLVVTAFLIGFPMMWLWNWLMPVLFGLKVITFWHALGLYLLAGFLFQSRHTIPSKKKRPPVQEME